MKFIEDIKVLRKVIRLPFRAQADSTNFNIQEYTIDQNDLLVVSSYCKDPISQAEMQKYEKDLIGLFQRAYNVQPPEQEDTYETKKNELFISNINEEYNLPKSYEMTGLPAWYAYQIFKRRNSTSKDIFQQQGLYREIKRMFAKPTKITGTDNIQYRVEIDGMTLTAKRVKSYLVEADVDNQYQYDLEISGNKSVLRKAPEFYKNEGYIAKKIFNWYDKVCDPQKTVSLSILDKIYLYNIFQKSQSPVIRYDNQNFMAENGLQMWVKDQSGKAEDPNRPLKGPIKFHNYEMGIRGRNDEIGYMRSVPAARSVFNKQMFKMMKNKWIREKSQIH